MEKYGVLEQEDTKTAAVDEERRCPACQSPLIPLKKVNVLKCPKCGTRPFETCHDT